MFYKDKKVLVTGGSGFVGTHFVQALLEQGASVRVPIHSRPLVVQSDGIETVPADLYNVQDCLRVCEGVDYVIHAAGAVAAAGVTVTNPMSAIAANLILEASGHDKSKLNSRPPTAVPVRIVDTSKAPKVLDFIGLSVSRTDRIYSDHLMTFARITRVEQIGKSN